MPALSPTMEEGTLAKWLVKVGDKINSGDLIAEIETDKATMEIEAVEDGYISKLIVEEGTQAVKINTPIAEFSETEQLRALNFSVPLNSAIGVLIFIPCAPSSTISFEIKPSSIASISIVALSVSISAIKSPELILSPTLTNHFARVPSSIVGLKAGINISLFFIIL